MSITEEVVDGITHRSWAAHTKQRQFIQIPFEVFEGLYGGAAFSGKSELLLLLPLIYGFVRRAGFKGLILRRTFPELESEIIKRSKDFYKLTNGEYNEQKKTWVWEPENERGEPIGEAYIQFGHAEHEADIRKYDTAQYNYVGFDELTSFTEFQYLYIALQRCRSGVPGLPAIVRSATNPGNIGHSWVKKRFVDPYKDGGKILKQYAGNDLITGEPKYVYRIFVRALPTDNTPGLKNDPDYINRLQLAPEAEKRAKLYGDWDTFEGQVFDDFRTERFPDEPDHALHCVDSFDLPAYWPRIVSIDWGFKAWTIIQWAALSPDGRVFVYREYCEKGKHVSEWGADFTKLSQGENVKGVILCHSAFAQRADPLTIAKQFYDETGVDPINGGRDRIGGKVLVQEYLRWRQKPKTKLPLSNFDRDRAAEILRNQGTKAYHDYLDLFVEQAEEKNLPKLIIFKDKCPELVKCLPLCVYNPDNKEDVAEFDGDDPYDTLRGLLKYANSFSAGLEDETKLLKKKEDAYSRLLQSGNQTAYYMEMRKFDAENKGFGVRSHSRVRRRR